MTPILKYDTTSDKVFLSDSIGGQTDPVRAVELEKPIFY